VAVAVGGSFRGTLVTAGADLLGGLGLDQSLQAGAHQFGEHRAGIGRGECIKLGEQGRMVVGHRVCVLTVSHFGR
jgi:hypothetical protein